MVAARRLAAAEAIRFLQVDEFDNSCDKDQDITTGSIMQATLENFDLSHCNSNEPSDQLIPKNFNEAQPSNNRWNHSFKWSRRFVETNQRKGKQRKSCN